MWRTAPLHNGPSYPRMRVSSTLRIRLNHQRQGLLGHQVEPGDDGWGCGASRRSTTNRHPPPPGLAFGEPDDRLRRGIQYSAAFRLNHERLGLLGRPVKPGDDGRACGASSHDRFTCQTAKIIPHAAYRPRGAKRPSLRRARVFSGQLPPRSNLPPRATCSGRRGDIASVHCNNFVICCRSDTSIAAAVI
jgi:hypothetical protein